jgi:hypothetical protein
MSNSENMPLKIYHAFEDLYFEKGKGKIFDEIFTKYFSFLDSELDQHMDLYDVLVLLSTKHRSLFDKMVIELKENSIIRD